MTKHKYPIIINGDNYQGGNRFRYTFPQGSVDLRSAKIALQSINIYYSWANISWANKNNVFTLAMPEGAGYAYYQVTIPDGYYSVATLYAFIQNFMIQNKMYMIDSNGNYVYFFEMIQNISYYAVQINNFIVYTQPELPAGWTVPAGFTYPTVVGRRPFITVGSSNNFGDLIGYEAGTYNQATQLSNKTPQMAVVQSVIVQCPNLRNIMSNPSTNLYTFTAGNTEYGGLISSNAYELVYADIIDSMVSYLDILLVDQNFNPVDIKDSNLTIQLIIKID